MKIELCLHKRKRMPMLKGKCKKCFEIILQKVGKCKREKKMINERNRKGKSKSKSRKWVYHKRRNDPWSDYL